MYLDRTVLQNAIRRYEFCWIPLLASVDKPSDRVKLVPPLDVEWVWFCHMLCPTKYVEDSAAMWRAVRPDQVNHIVDHKMLSGRSREHGKAKAHHFWIGMFPGEPFDVVAAS